MPSQEGVPVFISADEVSTSSLRAQRSNPEYFRGGSLDCFVARAPRNDGTESAPSLHKAKSFARRIHGPFVAQWQREHAVEIRARMFGVGHHHVEESAVDQGELTFRIEPDRLVVVGERAIVLSHVPKQTGATAVGFRIPRP